MDPASDVFWVFHDPARRSTGPMSSTGSGLQRMELYEDHRNPRPVAALAARFRDDAEQIVSLRQEGLPAEVIEAEPGRATVEALRTTLHRLLVEEQVPTFRVAVLSGRSAEKSDVWRQRRFGNAVLWNEAIDDDGPLARPAAGGGPGRARRRRPLRDHPPLQGPRARGHRPRRAPGRGRAPGPAPLRGSDPRDDVRGHHRATQTRRPSPRDSTRRCRTGRLRTRATGPSAVARSAYTPDRRGIVGPDSR